MKSWKIMTCATVALTLVASNTQATLIGDEVSVRFVIPNFSVDSTQTTTVAADDTDALTFNVGTASFIVDPFESGFVIDYPSLIGTLVSLDSFFEFFDLQWQDQSGEIVGVNLVEDWSVFGADDLFTADSATVDFTVNSTVLEGQQLTVTFETKHDPAPTNGAVPEPITAALGLIGLGVLGMATRRRTA